MKHTIEGYLVKYNIPWKDGIVFEPEAFDFQRNDAIPILVILSEREYTIGQAKLIFKKDGIYYKGLIFNSDVSDAIIMECINRNLDLGIRAVTIEKENNKIISAHISHACFMRITDGSAAITKIDDMNFIKESHEEDSKQKWMELLI